jgi:outer membrane protein OmpA-like peptidoglycan-associated protein
MQAATDLDLTPEIFDLFRSGHLGSFGSGYLADRIHTLADAYDFVQVLTQRHEGAGPWGSIRRITQRMRLSEGGVPTAQPQVTISAPLSAKLHIELLDVAFARGESDFPASEPWRQTQFQNLKQALIVSSEPLTIVVEGHAAPDEGDSESGTLLSARRAEAVQAALEQAGIPADRIRTVNLGISRPYCDDFDPQRDCAAWNQRVHFTY